MGHADVGTTQGYTDEIELDALQKALDDAYGVRTARASSEWTTLDPTTLNYPRNRLMEAAGIEPAEWPRGERARVRHDNARPKASGRVGVHVKGNRAGRSCGGLVHVALCESAACDFALEVVVGGSLRRAAGHERVLT